LKVQTIIKKKKKKRRKEEKKADEGYNKLNVVAAE